MAELKDGMCCKVLPEPHGSSGGADLRFDSPQPDTSFRCQTTDTGLVHCAVSVYSQLWLVLTVPIHGDCQAELTWVAGYIPGWFIRPWSVTHLSTNRVRRTVTSLIETSALLLSQAITTIYVIGQKYHFLPREAKRSAVLPWHVVRPSICNVEVS